MELKTETAALKYTLEAKRLMKSYKGRALVCGVSIHINKGEIIGLLGPNGAGKTTTFYMIAGLVRPDNGQIDFNGIDITNFPVYKRARAGLGYLAQEPSIFRKMTVEENIIAILEILHATKAQKKEKLERLLVQFNLAKVARQKAYTLSGGERRKLEIARSLVQDPEILMLDEPFAGVDPLAVIDIQQVVRDLKNAGYGILITDHNVRETLSVVDRAYLLYEGNLLSEGSSESLINDEKVREAYLGKEFKM